jgi:CHAT domain-containing protein
MPLKLGQNLQRNLPLKPRLQFKSIRLLLIASLLCLGPSHIRSSSHPPQANEDGPIELTPGVSNSYEIYGGSTRIFQILLGERQFLRLSIGKGDLNLSFALYNPRGEKLFEQTSRDYEAPEASLIAESAGAYSLQVHSLEVDAVGRRFDLKVEQLKAATPMDIKENVARASLAEASQLREAWEETSLRKAIDKYTEASLGWRAANKWREAIKALIKTAEVRSLLGEYRQALGLYKKAATQSSLIGDEEQTAEALSQSGRLYSYLGDNDEAQKQLDKSLRYYNKYNSAGQLPKTKLDYAEALSNMGEVYYSKGDLIKASQNFESSLGFFLETGDRKREAKARLFLGYIALSMGEQEKALDQFNGALALYRAVVDRAGEALSLAALGVTHSLRGEEQAALDLQFQTLNIFRAIGDRQSEALALNGIGQAYDDLNEKQVALDNFKQAQKLFLANGSLDFASGAAYQIAKVYSSMGDKQALAYYNECIRLSRAAKKARMEAYALNDVAAIYVSQGERRKALRQYRKILTFYDSIGDRRGQAITLNSIGDFYLSQKEKQKAINFYKQALPFSQHAGDKEVEISTLYNVARSARDCGEMDEALSYIEQSVKIIDGLRANVMSPDLRSSFFAAVYRHYGLYIDLLMQLDRRRPGEGYAAAALRASEGARARSLLEILAGAGTDIHQGVDQRLLDRERELQQMLKAKSLYLMNLNDSGQAREEAEDVAREVHRLTAEDQVLQAQMREQNPRYAGLVQPNPLSLDEIQAELRDRDTLLLEYALGDERSYLWAVTSDSLNSYELPARVTLEEAAREVYAALTARQLVGGKIDAGYQERVKEADRTYDEKALKLSRLILGPVAQQLGNKRLLIVSEGVLQYIPLDALPSPTQADEAGANTNPAQSFQEQNLLVSQHEIISLPSISTLATIRREKPKSNATGSGIAVLADPVFSAEDERMQEHNSAEGASIAMSRSDSDAKLSVRAVEGFNELQGGPGLGRLAHASEEADAIKAAAPAGPWMVVKGFDATREAAMSSSIGQYQVVHFATHGFINSQQPELSGIVLTMINRNGGRENGFLQLQDIYNLNLSADLVVLSACSTGLGKDIKGEGLVGLTRGFMYAGAKSVVASLWEVDDRATAELMGHFYKAMLQDGLTPAAALKSAKEAMRRQSAWRAPYFWAGFVLHGEYQEHIKVSSHPSPLKRSTMLLLLTPALVLVCFLIFKRRRRASGLL